MSGYTTSKIIVHGSRALTVLPINFISKYVAHVSEFKRGCFLAVPFPLSYILYIILFFIFRLILRISASTFRNKCSFTHHHHITGYKKRINKIQNTENKMKKKTLRIE